MRYIIDIAPNDGPGRPFLMHIVQQDISDFYHEQRGDALAEEIDCTDAETEAEALDLAIESLQQMNDSGDLPYDVERDYRDAREEFTETPAGEEARYQRARQYDDLNGAPESEEDR